jgi:hypothetical protein
METLIQSFGWLILTLGPLIWLQPRLHKEIQLIFLLLTRNRQIAVLLFSLIFLPGVFLHESSHFLMAKILRVPTGRFSIFPQETVDGRLQLGYVEIGSTDHFRASLIGAAPLLAGMATVAYIGFVNLKLDLIWLAGQQAGAGDALTAFFGTFGHSDVWLWFYLALTISSTMFPSASDRKSWVWVGGIAIALFVLVVFLGAGNWLIEKIVPGMTSGISAASVVFGMASSLHLLLLLPLLLLRRLLVDVMNVEIQMG